MEILLEFGTQPVDHRLYFEPHVSCAVSKVYALSLLNRFKKYIAQELRLNLAPTFLYLDVVYFPSLTGVAYRRLELAFNVRIRQVYYLRHFDFYHCSQEGNSGLRPVHVFGNKRAPVYLSSYLQLGSSMRYRQFVMPKPELFTCHNQREPKITKI
jgi:hypothetical protein